MSIRSYLKPTKILFSFFLGINISEQNIKIARLRSKLVHAATRDACALTRLSSLKIISAWLAISQMILDALPLVAVIIIANLVHRTTKDSADTWFLQALRWNRRI